MQDNEQPLDAPDSPGWWAFEGSEWGSEAIWPNGMTEQEVDEDNSWVPIEPIGYREILKEPFRAVLDVRWVYPGQAISIRKYSGPYEGTEPILGFVSPKYRWNHALYGIDTVCGKWTRLTMPWEHPASADNVKGEEI